MKAVFAILYLSLLVPAGLHCQDHFQLSGKEKKLVTGSFGKAAKAEPLPLHEPADALSGYLHPGDRIHIIKQEEDTIGFLFSTRAKGRFDYFDYCILFSTSLQVEEVVVTVYRSTHGAAISRKSWLDQFAGYEGGGLELGKNIDAISGGTLSAASMVSDIRRCHEMMTCLRAQGTI